MSALQDLQEAADELSRERTYRIGPLETHSSAEERLGYRLDRAEALILQITNLGLGSFNSLNLQIQDAYLQAILEQVNAAMLDFHLVQKAHQKELEQRSKH